MITTFSSFQFNQSVNTDLVTGAYSRGDGIGRDDIVIQVNAENEKRNEFIFLSKSGISF